MERYLKNLLFAFIAISTVSCAKIGSLEGGPKDETPPKVIKTKPPENSINFIPQKRIVITFDEYIEVKNIFQELIVSPPLDGTVTAHVNGKDLIVEFPSEAVFDTLTYTLDFGNSITDYNEGNILEGYRYIFSLNNYIDSMNVEGKLLNAFNHQPDKDRMLVMLYRNLNDSAPCLEKPSYVGRSDESGNFSLHHIKTGEYRIFALKDANSNLLYDLPNEQIAFSDSIIELTKERFQDNIIVDDTILLSLLSDSLSLLKDTLKPKKIGKPEGFQLPLSDSLTFDSTFTDSLTNQQKKYTYHTELFFFTKVSENQYMTNNSRPEKEQLLFTFNEKLKDSVELFPLNFLPVNSGWYLLDMNKEMDTLKYWITDTAMLAMDSLKMEVCYPMLDSSGEIFDQTDTLLMMVEQAKETRTRRDRLRPQKEQVEEQQPEGPQLMLQNNITNTNAFDLDKKIVLKSPRPVSEIFPKGIKLYRVQDTLEFPVKIEVFCDTNSFYNTIVQYKPESSTMYRLFIPDSTVFDIYGAANDTTIVNFKTQADDYYGALSLHLKGVKEPILLQLLDESEKLLKERKVNTDESIRFEYMHPKKYILKIIVDSNGNGKWDSGDYLNHIQPEKVIYYPQIIDIRSNWEMDFIWELKSEN